MGGFFEVALADGVVVMDGGMGQELAARGLQSPNALWSAWALIQDPRAVKSVHEDYLRAGAEILITNTYATTRYRLSLEGMEDRFEELNQLAGRLAKEAREELSSTALVAGSLPPIYGSYRPDLVGTVEHLEPLYAEQAAVLAPYVDFFLCETMSTSSEALAATRGAAATGKPVWVSWTLADDEPPRLRSGETLEEAFHMLDGVPVSGFMVNCCWPEVMTKAIPELRALTDQPVGGYANGFEPIPEKWRLIDGDAVPDARQDLDPDAYAEHARHWIEAGAKIVGGCCEVGPAHIARISELVAEINAERAQTVAASGA